MNRLPKRKCFTAIKCCTNPRAETAPLVLASPGQPSPLVCSTPAWTPAEKQALQNFDVTCDVACEVTDQIELSRNDNDIIE